MCVQIVVDPDVLLDPVALRGQAARYAKIRERRIHDVVVTRKRVDARRGRVRLVVDVELWLDRPARSREPPQPLPLATQTGLPIVAIVGAGPAGLFCALRLAQRGIKAVVFERGKLVRARRHDIAALSQRGALARESNYAFGEGGAGTFSDGKLYTRASKRGSVRWVLEQLVAYGATPEILVDAKPHIGTNHLPAVITRMREHLTSAGVDTVFDTRVDGLRQQGNRVTGIALADGSHVEARAVVLAPGHSARDVYGWLAHAGVRLSFKPFALGVRIEHPQAYIDALQYKAFAGHPALGAASYSLALRSNDVGVFSFCMCPGGYIVPATADPDRQVVNGMSPSNRRGRFANAGFVVEIGPKQLAWFGLAPEHAFAGLELQDRLERAAFEAGGGAYVAPAQRLDDFVAGRASTTLPDNSYHRGVMVARLDTLLGALAHPIRDALLQAARSMPDFLGDHAIAVGVESRTSAPVRVERDAATMSVSHEGLYPCGEGAGFAGGIVSAALDGIRVADAIASARSL